MTAKDISGDGRLFHEVPGQQWHRWSQTWPIVNLHRERTTGIHHTGFFPLDPQTRVTAGLQIGLAERSGNASCECAVRRTRTNSACNLVTFTPRRSVRFQP